MVDTYPCAPAGGQPVTGTMADPTGLADHIATDRVYFIECFTTTFKTFIRENTIRFMAVQFCHLRGICAIPESTISNDALVELCYIRSLAVKMSLISPNYAIADHHVRYNEAAAFPYLSNVAAPGDIADGGDPFPNLAPGTHYPNNEYNRVLSVCLFVCWSLTSLCHSNGHIETMPAREINPFTALTRIRS